LGLSTTELAQLPTYASLLEIPGAKPLQELAQASRELPTRELAAPVNSAAERGAPERLAVVDEQRRTLSESQRAVLATIETVMRQRGDSERAVALASSIAAERFQSNRVYVGKVIEHGEAPYENNARNEQSYYLKLDTPKGEKVVWGVDLKRALAESGVGTGDEVAIANQGKREVPVRVKDRDDKGGFVGLSEIVVSRNSWDVRKVELLRPETKDRLTAAAEKADRAPQIKVYDRTAERTQQRPDVTLERSRVPERS
jgi:hypothetical protein